MPWLLLALVAGSLVYCVLTIVAAVRYRARAPAAHCAIARPSASSNRWPESTTAWKKTCARSSNRTTPISKFCSPCATPDDPAIAVAERLRARYPGVPSRLIVTGEPPYPNAKVYSLDRMLAAARHDLLVMSDSDIRVTPDMLAMIAAEFQDAKLGLATCPYRAVPGRSFWNTLEAVGLNTEFIGGVLVARMLDGMKFALGPTIAARRATLAGIGGFDAVKDFLAEDFVMGKLAAERGDGVILSSYVIEHRIGAQTLGGQPEASPALESQHAPLASRGLRRTALHQSAAAGAAAVGGAPGVVAGRGGDGRCCARPPDGPPPVTCCAIRSRARLFFLVPVQDLLELRDVARRLLRQYHPLARAEILPAGGRTVRTGAVTSLPPRGRAVQ